MSSVSLKTIEIENFGRFYDSARLEFNSTVNAVIMGASQGKTTFINALEYLSKIVLDGFDENHLPNFCNSCPVVPS